jgi:hypothetical protein
MCRQKFALEKVFFRYHPNRFGTKKSKKALKKKDRESVRQVHIYLNNLKQVKNDKFRQI